MSSVLTAKLARLLESYPLFGNLLLYHIIYSGTPENVGPAVSSDRIEMHLGGLPKLSVKIV